MGSRHSRVKIETDLLSQLGENTEFTEDHLKSWHAAFLSECPNGRLSEREFGYAFRKLFPLPTATDQPMSEAETFKAHDALSQLIFRGFATSPDNTTDFKGFATVLSTICRGAIEAKSHWLHGIIDSDGKGGVSHGDLTNSFQIVVTFIQSITGCSAKPSVDIARERADDIFSSLQKNRDEILSSEDFLSWIKQNEEVVGNLNLILSKNAICHRCKILDNIVGCKVNFAAESCTFQFKAQSCLPWNMNQQLPLDDVIQS